MANNLNFFRGEYSDYLVLKDEGKVLDSNLYFTMPDEQPKEDDKKSSNYCLFQGEVLLACSANYEDIQTVLADIVGLKDDLASLEERIGKISLELATYEIKQLSGDTLAALGANVKEAYALYKITPSVEEGGQATEELVGETVKIYKDSALQKVEMVNQKLQFTYLTASGGTEVVDVDVSTFLAEAEFGNGLEVIDGVAKVKAYNGIEVSENGVAAKVAAATVSAQTPIKDVHKNFLSVDSNGLAVKSVDTDATVLQKEIKVAGLNGTLGTGNYKNGDTIAVGTDIYTILQNILSQEIYPTLTSSNYKTAAITSKIKAPTITLSKTGTQIYGADVTLSVSCSDLVVSTTPNEVNGLTNGYSSTDDDSADSTNTKITKNVSSAITDANYTLSATFTGFTSQANLTKSGETSVCKFDKQALGKVTMGDNKVAITITGPIVSGHAESISSGYTVSNLGNTDSGKTYNGKSEYNATLTRPTSGSSATVTGVLPCFANVSGGALVDTPAQLSLTTGKEFTITVPSENAAKKHFMFDFPADRTVSSFKVKDLQGNFVAFEAAYSQNTEVEKTINGFTMKYKRLTTTGDYVGDGVYKITLSTNLNSADMSKVLKNNN